VFLKLNRQKIRQIKVLSFVTGRAVALHCCKALAKINRKMGNSTPVKSEPLKISSSNFAYVITSGRLPTMQILVSIGTVGASPQIGEMLPPCDFWLSCPVLSCHYVFSRSCAQVEMLDRFSRFMAQTTRMVLLGVRTIRDHILGNMPQNP